jgi:Skp family chaperone for outer membrane proteins
MKACNAVKRFAHVVAPLLLVFLFTGLSAAADVKFGIINYEVIQKKSAKIAAGISDIQQVQQEAQVKMSALAKDMNALQERLSKEEASLSAQDKEKLGHQLNEKRQEIETEQQAVRVKMAFKRDTLTKTISALLNEIIAKIAKEDGLAIVFRSDSIAYSEGAVDISDKVAKALDEAPVPGEQVPEQKPAQPKPEKKKPEQKPK